MAQQDLCHKPLCNEILEIEIAADSPPSQLLWAVIAVPPAVTAHPQLNPSSVWHLGR